MIIPIDPSRIPYSKKMQSLCKKPFYGHPDGCPNWGKKEGCPPHQPMINEIFDFSKEMSVIYTSFNVGQFAERMRKNHPEWEGQLRQLYNPRRWQPASRKEHRMEINEYLEKQDDERIAVTTFPEALGVQITGLMKIVGVELDWKWPPEHSICNLIYTVSLGGTLRDRAERNRHVRLVRPIENSRISRI